MAFLTPAKYFLPTWAFIAKAIFKMLNKVFFFSEIVLGKI
jgi:hypothetical protein